MAGMGWKTTIISVTLFMEDPTKKPLNKRAVGIEHSSEIMFEIFVEN